MYLALCFRGMNHKQHTINSGVQCHTSYCYSSLLKSVEVEPELPVLKTKLNSVAFPRANYTDRTAAAGRRS